MNSGARQNEQEIRLLDVMYVARVGGVEFWMGGRVDIHLTDVSTYIQLEITPSHLLLQLRLSKYFVLKCYNGILSCHTFYWEWCDGK